jgi:hypothetical protein
MNNKTLNCPYLNIAPHRPRAILGLTKCSSSSLKRVQLQNILHCSATEEHRHADCISNSFREIVWLVSRKEQPLVRYL